MYGNSFKLALRAALIAVALIVLVMAFGGGVAAGRWLIPACPPDCPACAECPDCHEVEEYYRGVYDLCVSFKVGSAFCLRAIGNAHSDERHALPSPGWRWPPSTEPEAAR